MEIDNTNISVNGDTRPITCRCCGRKLYYGGHAKHEPEVEILVKGPAHLGDHFYAHVRCWSVAIIHIVGCEG